MKQNKSSSLAKILALCLGLAIAGFSPFGSQSAHATSDTWTGAANTTWSTSGNWSTSPVAVPGTGDTATFNGAGNGNVIINLGGGVTINTILFDTASAAAYTIGSGAVGSQTLTLDNAGAITMNATVANNQLFNANINLSSAASATATITNNSSSLLTIAGGIAANVASGNGVLNVNGTGNTTITGTVTKPGAGSNALMKTGSGTLTLSSNTTWSGTGAIGFPATGFPLVAREGVLLITGGTHTVTGEAVVGGVVTNGGSGTNTKLQMDGGTLNVTSWLSVGKGNGVGGVSSDLVLNNGSIVTAANFSGGYNATSALNLPKGSITLNNTSSLTIASGGAFNLAESAGSNFTAILNDSATLSDVGAGIKYIGQSGTGSMTLNGSSSVNFGSGVTRIGNASGAVGTLKLNGSSSFATTNTAILGGAAANSKGTLIMNGGTFSANNMFLGDGGAITSAGAVYQSGGTVTLTQAANVDNLRIGSSNNGYGYYSLSGEGTVTANEIGIGASLAATVGVVDVSGGTFTSNGYLAIGRGTTTTSGVLNVTGGAVTAVRIENAWAGNVSSVSVLNVGGGAGAATVGTTASATLGLNLLNSNTAGTLSVANLLTNGTLTTGKVYASGGANPTALLNFNGGTLKAATTNAGGSFLSDTNIDGVYVYGGGGTIDNNGTSITVGKALAGATGNGVTTIFVTAGGSGYVGAPLVTISGGTGNTATGYAVMADDGTGNGTYKVSSIVITSPGTYTVDPTTVTLSGGGSTTAATIGTITTAANTSGGMTFQGAGTTTLTATSTYTGATNINAGTLAVNGSLSGTGAVAVNATSTLGGSGTINGATTVNANGTLAPGSSAGLLTFANNLNFSDINSKANFEIATGTRGTNYDAVNVAGTLTYKGQLTLTIATAIADGIYDLFGGALAGALTQTGNLDGIAFAVVGPYSGVFTPSGSGDWTATSGGQNFTFTQSTGDLTVVPEPGTWAMLLGGIGLLVLFRRRRS
jgi:hypothetical protein